MDYMCVDTVESKCYNVHCSITCTIPSFQHPNYWPASRSMSNQHPTCTAIAIS